VLAGRSGGLLYRGALAVLLAQARWEWHWQMILLVAAPGILLVVPAA
jgi:hypothetical protein